MLKKLFNKFSGSRFIDIHGRPWHKSGVMDKIEPFYYMAGGLALSGIFYSASFAPNFLQQTFTAAAKDLFWAAALFHIYRDHPLYPPATLPLKDYAIDKEGRSFPPENNTTLLLKTADLYDHRKSTLLFFVAVIYGIEAMEIARGHALMQGLPSFNTPNPISYLQNHFGLALTYAAKTVAAPLAIYQDMRRAKKLLDKKYVFCGTPPKEPKKEKTGVLAGVAKPSMG